MSQNVEWNPQVSVVVTPNRLTDDSSMDETGMGQSVGYIFARIELCVFCK